MTSARSFKRNWIKASWLVILGAVIGAALRVTWIQAQPKVYVCAAKLTVNPALEASREVSEAESQALFDAKQETRHQIEGAELQERALRRFLAREKFAGRNSLSPTGTTRIETADGSEPAIVMVNAFGMEPRHSRQFLDAVLDEFMYSVDSEAMKASALGGFRIAVLERASGAIEENRELWFPAVVFGIAGGLCGFALSLCLADWMTKKQVRPVSPNPQPSVIRRAARESFYQTSSRFSGLVLIGMSLGISVQFLSMHEDDQRPFWSAKLEARSQGGRRH